MSSRQLQKEQARAERLEKEQMAQRRQHKQRRMWQLGSTLAFVVIVIVGAIMIGQSGKKKPASNSELRAQGAETEALFAGIPQRGVTLGDPNAPVQMIEYADLKCPVCAIFSGGVFPDLVKRYVRTGKLRVEFRNLTFIPPDSRRGAELAAAAGMQNHLFEFTHLFFRNQSPLEHDPYVTDAFLRSVADVVPGLNVDKAFADRSSPLIAKQLQFAQKTADSLNIHSTPAFLFAVKGEKPTVFKPGAIDVDTFAAKIDALVKKR